MVFSMDAIDLNNPTNLETKKIIAKKMLKKYVVQDHHLIKSTRVIVLDKLTAREYIFSVTTTPIYSKYSNTPTSKKHLEKFFRMKNLTGKKIIYYQELSL